MPDGGIIEGLHHIGSTSLPGMPSTGGMDIGASVWPFPLEPGPRSRLEALGYHEVEGFNKNLQFFIHTDRNIQLILGEAGTEGCFDLVIVRDYLLHDEHKRDEISKARSNGNFDKSKIFPQLIQEGHQWWIEHHGFSALENITNEFKDSNVQWSVAGGWALDLFLDKVQRIHLDVDIIVERDDQLKLQKHLLERDWKLLTPLGKNFEPWPLHMRIELPRHQIHAHRNGEFIDILLTDMRDAWRYRRNPVIIRSLEKMNMQSRSGIPHLSPELVLLFKSMNTSDHERNKDESDFTSVLQHLEPERRSWLYWALTATTPEHPWITKLSGGFSKPYIGK